jgi:hypothetical protein
MRIASTKPLFAWDCLDDSPSLQALRELIALIPDGPLLENLRAARGKGRDDYPVSVLWGVVLLTIMLRHSTYEACLAELRRNAGLRKLLGLDCEEAVPRKWNISRFLDVLGQEPFLSQVREAFNTLLQRLGQAVPDLGRHTAGDATYLNARHKNDGSLKEELTTGLPQPAGGRKEYTDDQGNVVEVLEWYGYKLHLLVDVKHEVALAYQVTAPTAGDGETLPSVLEQAQANLAPGRIETLTFDKAADDERTHEVLRAARIKPVIQMRNLWKDELERMLPGATGRDNIVYNEAGTLFCYDKVSDPPVRHRMAYVGHEAARGTLKYRCPACYGEWRCPSAARCNGQNPYGMTVRVKKGIDLRRFPPIPRQTKEFERLYKGRTAVERVNARLKIFWGVDDGNITGAQRFHAQVGVVMLVHAAFATLLARAPRREGTLCQTRLSPIQQALRGET